MRIEKNGVLYRVTESQKTWKLTMENGPVTVLYEVSKNQCETEDELRSYVQKAEGLFLGGEHGKKEKDENLYRSEGPI